MFTNKAARVVKPLVLVPRNTMVVNAQAYKNVELAENDFANIQPFTTKPATSHPRMKYNPESSAPGVRDTSRIWKKHENNFNYNLAKQLGGYNDLLDDQIIFERQAFGKNLIGTPLKDIYTKKYVRDPATGEATFPKYFEGKLTHDEVQTILQKADHYFFQDRPTPKVQLYVPLDDPRVTAPKSKLALAVEVAERKLDKFKRKATDLKATDLNDQELDDYLSGELDKMYNAKPDYNVLQNESMPDIESSTYSAYTFTAQQRRAEFWNKYMRLFKYYDLLHSCTVRCTRATGRVDASCALVIMSNGHGIFTYGRGKGVTHEIAVRRAIFRTRRNVLFTPLHENRTCYYRIMGTWNHSSMYLKPAARGIGIRAGPFTYPFLRMIGYKDASLKLYGRRNLWNMIRAWMECLKIQESYREIAFSRGAHYQHILDPFTKNPPPPSRDEIQDLEDAAAKAFGDAVKTIFKNRQLLQTETFKELRPHFEAREGFEAKWKNHLENMNVPEALHMYPPFSQYLDCATALTGVRDRIVQEQRFAHNFSATFASNELAEWEDVGKVSYGKYLLSDKEDDNLESYGFADEIDPTISSSATVGYNTTNVGRVGHVGLGFQVDQEHLDTKFDDDTVEAQRRYKKYLDNSIKVEQGISDIEAQDKFDYSDDPEEDYSTFIYNDSESDGAEGTPEQVRATNPFKTLVARGNVSHRADQEEIEKYGYVRSEAVANVVIEELMKSDKDLQLPHSPKALGMPFAKIPVTTPEAPVEEKLIRGLKKSDFKKAAKNYRALLDNKREYYKDVLGRNVQYAGSGSDNDDVDPVAALDVIETFKNSKKNN